MSSEKGTSLGEVDVAEAGESELPTPATHVILTYFDSIEASLKARVAWFASFTETGIECSSNLFKAGEAVYQADKLPKTP